MSRSQRHKKELQGVVSDDPIGTWPTNPQKYPIGGDTAPTNLVLSPATIAGNAAAGALVGTIAITDAGSTKWLLELTDDDGGRWYLDPDNRRLRKVAATTIAAATRAVTCKVTDDAGNTYSKSLSITVT